MVYYLIFTLTTAILACYSLYRPVYTKLKREYPKHNLVDYKYVGYFTFFCLSVLVAPIVFFAIIFPEFKASFVDSMYGALDKD